MNELETSYWIRMELALWDTITAEHSPIQYRKKHIIFHQGQSAQYVYIVKNGRIRVTSFQSNGEEKQIYIAEVGAICGESACAKGQEYSTTGIAIVDSEVYCISYKTLEQAMRADWALTRQIMGVMCRKRSILQQQVMGLAFTQSTHRVAQLLLDIVEQYGNVQENGSIRISIKFTHQDFASMINTSRVTVSNIFNSLSSQGILVREKGFFTVNDLSQLQKIACCSD